MVAGEKVSAQAPAAGLGARDETRRGVVLAIAAYVWWGLSALYFKLLTHVPATVVLGHRIVWSVVLLFVLIGLGRHWPEVRAAVRDRRTLGWLVVSTLLLSVNWWVFIYAIESKRLVEASLGYFVNPLLTVALGMIFLGERLRPRQWLATLIAGAALVYLTIARGGLPWIALALPILFGFYGLIRKQLTVGAIPGFFIETGVLAPAAAVYLAIVHASSGAEAINTPRTLGILALAGIVTAVPILWFVAATKRLTLTAMGYLQYMNPTMQFLTAVVLFGEPLGQDRLIAFTLIWIAVGIFVWDSLARARASLGVLQADAR